MKFRKSVTKAAITDAMDDHRKATRPTRDIATNIGNLIGIGLYRVAGALMAAANWLLDRF